MSQNSDKQTKHKSRWKHKVNAFDNDRWMAIQTQRNCLKLVRCRTYPEDTLAQTDWQSRQADRQLRCSNNHCVYTSGPLEINKRGCVCSLCWGNCTIGKRILNFIRRFRMFPLICLHPSASLSVSLGVSVCLFVSLCSSFSSRSWFWQFIPLPRPHVLFFILPLSFLM